MDPHIRRTALSLLALSLASTLAQPAWTQDVIALETVSGANPGQTVNVDLGLRDRPGTPLGNGGSEGIQGLSVTVEWSPAAAVEAVEFRRRGTTAGRPPRFETQVAGPGRQSWIVAFDQPLALGDAVETSGRLRVRLADDVAPGTAVTLHLVPATTALANGDGAIVETAASGQLELVDGSVTVRGGEPPPPPPPAACTTASTLCLLDERFRVDVAFRDFAGATGTGRAVQLTSDAGYFWFFDAANVEIVVKALDGRGLNGHFWVFYGALSNVEFTLTVTDSVTGLSREYENPLGEFASVGDTEAFAGDGLELGSTAGRMLLDLGPVALAGKGGSCVPDASSLCLLDGRFRLRMSWSDFAGATGDGQAVPLTSDSGYFWFFDPANVELVVKTLDGRGVNGRFWVFYGALSNVEFALQVTDTVTGEQKTYRNPLGTFASVGDTGAF